MALSDYLTGDLFKRVTETGQEGSRALFNAYLGNQYRDWGGMMSPQARHMGAQFDPIWSQYLGELLSASPASGLKRYGAPHMPGRGNAYKLCRLFTGRSNQSEPTAGTMA